MPYVSKPINDWNLENASNYQPEPFPASCPICGRPVSISETGKSAYCTNPDCGGRQEILNVKKLEYCITIHPTYPKIKQKQII